VVKVRLRAVKAVVKVERERGEREEGMGQICEKEEGEEGEEGGKKVSSSIFNRLPSLKARKRRIATQREKTHLHMRMPPSSTRPCNFERNHLRPKLRVALLERLFVPLDFVKDGRGEVGRDGAEGGVVRDLPSPLGSQ
jgi:hypothetical protein